MVNKTEAETQIISNRNELYKAFGKGITNE
jgi:hypothetical protein